MMMVEPKALGDLNAQRLSFGLYAPSGMGKTLQAASFAGKEHGKIIFVNVEVGPEEGGGGLTTLFHCDGIYPQLDVADLKANTKVLSVRTWEDMQSTLAWLQVNKAQLVEDGYRLLVLDGGTALSYAIKLSFTQMEPEHTASSKRHNIIGALVTDALGNATSNMELAYYDHVYDRFIQMHSCLKQLPFTFVATYLEDVAYDEETHKIPIGRGPKLIGKKLPTQIRAEVDGFFHLEIQNGERVWMTANEPTMMGNMDPSVAKHRFCNKLDKYEPADGVKLFRKLGVIG